MADEHSDLVSKLAAIDQYLAECTEHNREWITKMDPEERQAMASDAMKLAVQVTQLLNESHDPPIDLVKAIIDEHKHMSLIAIIEGAGVILRMMLEIMSDAGEG
jgi:hypothetical protein